MGVLVTQKCSEGRKENYWFTDSTNEIEAMVRNLDVWGNTSDRYSYSCFVGGIYYKVSEFTIYFL